MRRALRLTDPTLAALTLGTLLALWALADRLAPHEGLSDQGCRIGAVLDGDTVQLICGAEIEPARLQGFDTPETRDAACAAERALGKRATQHLRGLVSGARPGITDLGHDKYGRRLIRLRLDGQEVADLMIAAGLATRYDGGQRIRWCDRLAP